MPPKDEPARFVVALARQLTQPAQLALVPGIAILAVAQRYGFVADRAWWFYPALLVSVTLTTSTVDVIWPDRTCTDRQMVYRTSTMIAAMTVAMYATGWGPTLAVVYGYAMAYAIRYAGSKAAPPIIGCAVVSIFVGQVAIVLGIAPTLVPEPLVHGLAALVIVGTALSTYFQGFVVREREELEVALQQRDERLRALMANTTDIIAIFDPDGAVLFASPSLERTLGYPNDAEDLAGFGVRILHPDDRERARAFFASFSASPGETAWAELRFRDAGGRYLWFEVGVTNLLADPSVGGLVANLRNVTERKQLQDRLTYQAYHDPLTELPNRVAFLERLDAAVDRAERQRRRLAVLFLDADRFKEVNDSRGHEVGDRLLQAIAQRLRGSVRPGDVVARFGGDEFTVLLEDVDDPSDAVRVAERIGAAFGPAVPLAGGDVEVSVSTGIAVSQPGATTADELLREADLAMYLAKQQDGSRWAFADASGLT